MLDIVKALEWVHKNIAAFGGDPDNVTIFGQSGGGGKVNTMLVAPSAKGLFNKGIIESGSMINFMDQAKAKEVGREVVANLGLDKNTIDKIQDIPYSELLDAATKEAAELHENNRLLIEGALSAVTYHLNRLGGLHVENAYGKVGNDIDH